MKKQGNARYILHGNTFIHREVGIECQLKDSGTGTFEQGSGIFLEDFWQE